PLHKAAPSRAANCQPFGQTFITDSGSPPKDRFTNAYNKATGKAANAGAKAQGFGVAAALGANRVTDATTAALGDSVHVTAAGPLAVTTSPNTDADAEGRPTARTVPSHTSI